MGSIWATTIQWLINAVISLQVSEPDGTFTSFAVLG
jgi:hypothetical protein